MGNDVRRAKKVASGLGMKRRFGQGGRAWKHAAWGCWHETAAQSPARVRATTRILLSRLTIATVAATM
jgi:hypothetical protein